MNTTITPESLADLEKPQDVRVSRDGNYAVYVTKPTARKTKGLLKSSLWLAKTGEGNSAKTLANGQFHDEMPAFSPDSKCIAFLSDRAQAGEDKDIYLLWTEDLSKITKLTSSTEHGMVQAFKWSPDGTFLAFNSRPKDDPKIDIKVFGENLSYRNLWMYDIRSHAASRLLTEDVDVSDFDVGVDGDKLTYCTQADPELSSADRGQEVRVLEIATKTSERIFRAHCRVSHIVWSKNGPMATMTYNLGGPCHTDALYAFQDGKHSHVAYGEVNAILDLKSCWGEPVAYVQEGMLDKLCSLDSSLYDVKRTIWSYDVATYNEKQTIVTIEDTTGVPPEVYSVINGEALQLSDHGHHITALKLGNNLFIDETNDDLPMDGIYSIPTSLQSDFDNKKPLPTIVIVKGGPGGRTTDGFDGASVAHIAPLLMSQNYLLLHPNYRGGTSHGDAYARTVIGNVDISYDDVIWHVKKGIKDGHIDPNKVAITGWSQGGYISYLAVTRDSTFHFVAAAACAGVSDWYSTVAFSDLVYFERTLAGYTPWDKAAPDPKLRPANPIHYAEEVTTPILMLHGEVDAIVPVQNALVFSRALQELGKPFEMAIYPREDHGSPFGWERDHYLDMLERLTKFFAKHLRGEK